MANLYDEAVLTLDWDEAFSADPVEAASGDVCPADALIMSVANHACVNLTYIAGLTGLDRDQVISSLKGLIYQNPETWNDDPYEGWETREEYLSGNLRSKRKAAVRDAKKIPSPRPFIR